MKRMKRVVITMSAFMAVLFLASCKADAQERKVEKTVKIVTVNEKGVEKDTVFTITDTADFNANEFVIRTKDGKVMIGKGHGKNIIWVGEDFDLPPMPDMPCPPAMRHMMIMGNEGENAEGVNYHLSVDGVTVNIRATKEKAAEADRILAEVKKILMTK